MDTFRLKIVLRDGTELYIHDVTNYELSPLDQSVFVVSFENGHRALFPVNSVAYIGRAYDLEKITAIHPKY